MGHEVTAVSWSELKTFQRCPKQWDYKYGQDLSPIKKARPLFLGSWIHKALETYYKDGDWKIGHREYTTEFDKLFAEEQESLSRGRKKQGSFTPLPTQVTQILKSYLWYYKDDGWKVRQTEKKFEVWVPQLKLWIKGVIDLIVEDEEGKLWVVDHKTATTIPEPTAFHAMDPQLMLYPWAAKEAWDLDIFGIIYNYVKSRPPTIPKLNQDGSISRRKVLTDYPTALRFYRENGFDPNDFRDVLLPLRRKSPFLRRYRLPREPHVTREILLDSLSTAKRIRESNRFTRTITRDCARMCPYHDLCRDELNGFDTEIRRKTEFTHRQTDPAFDLDINDMEDEDGEE